MYAYLASIAVPSQRYFLPRVISGETFRVHSQIRWNRRQFYDDSNRQVPKRNDYSYLSRFKNEESSYIITSRVLTPGGAHRLRANRIESPDDSRRIESNRQLFATPVIDYRE